MVNRGLFDKVICRVMKENNCYQEFKQKYNYQQTSNIAKKFIGVGSLCSLSNLFVYNDDIHILLHKNGRHIYNQISKILLQASKFYLIQFLYDNSIFDKFNFYLVEHAKTNYYRKDNIKSIDDYIEYVIKNNEIYGLPINLFFTSFQYCKTDEGFIFWSELNKKFMNYMINILFK